MRRTLLTSKFIALIAVLLLSVFAVGVAGAQQSSGEPTVAQIYQTANAGDLARAQTMIDSVIEKHPNSARAHYVKAEIAARQKNMTAARAELATADRLAPGLPFAKAESVQTLRSQIEKAPPARAAINSTSSDGGFARQLGAARDSGANEPAPSRSIPWGMLALVAAIVVGAAAFMRRRAAARDATTFGGAGYGNAANIGGGATGFGGNVNPTPYGNQPAYGPGYGPANGPGYGPGYPQGPGNVPPGAGYNQPSMGGSVMRGLGAGLAVGAGAVAAQEIGRRIFSHDDPHHAANNAATGSVPPDPAAIDNGMLNSDMGGDNFGMTGGGWDDGGGGDFAAGDAGGGSDWDT